MKRLRYCPETYRILGPTASREGSIVEVEDELFARIAFDMSAFRYHPLNGTVELAPDFVHKPADEPKAALISEYTRGLLEFTYIPELEASITLSGDLGRATLFALSSSIYYPQTIFAKTDSGFIQVEVSEEVAGYICQALKAKTDSILGSNQ